MRQHERGLDSFLASHLLRLTFPAFHLWLLYDF